MSDFIPPQHWQEKTNAVRASLTNDLRHPKYRNHPNPMVGHCYVASEALYHMLGGKDAGWKPMFIRHEDEPHWYLKHHSGHIIDPTADQFKTKVPYEHGIGKGFLTHEPSKRAVSLIEKVSPTINKSENDLLKAISDNKPGQLLVEHPSNGNRLYDYGHMLHPDLVKQGYGLRVHDQPRGGKIHVEISYKRQPVGFLSTVKNKQDASLEIDHSDLELDHCGKGLGTHMYEAALTHGFHSGIKSVSGGAHSTMASRVHASLAAKHGLDYKPQPNPKLKPDSFTLSSGEYDGKFGPYSYLIKSDSSYRPPWTMTFQEFMGHKIGSPMGDRSRDPGSVEQLKADTAHLHSYRDDDFAVKDWLGRGYSREYDMSHLAEHVKQNKPIKIYRATDKEDTIHPGAYVTPSRTYAEHHGERNMGGAKYHVLEHVAHPDELLAMNPNEFFYAPRDLKHWHKTTVERAIKEGKDVPSHVAQEHGLTLPPKIMKSDADVPAYTRKSAVAVLIERPDGLFLMGQRRDSGKWTCPAGHIEAGEKPHEAAIREIFEETGLIPVILHSIGTANGGKHGEVPLYLFRAMASGTPTSQNDPDREFLAYKWFSMYENLPPNIDLHHENDAILRAIGIDVTKIDVE